MKRVAVLLAAVALIVVGASVVKPTTAVNADGPTAGQGQTDGWEWN